MYAPNPPLTVQVVEHSDGWKEYRVSASPVQPQNAQEGRTMEQRTIDLKTLRGEVALAMDVTSWEDFEQVRLALEGLGDLLSFAEEQEMGRKFAGEFGAILTLCTAHLTGCIEKFDHRRDEILRRLDAVIEDAGDSEKKPKGDPFDQFRAEYQKAVNGE